MREYFDFDSNFTPLIQSMFGLELQWVMDWFYPGLSELMISIVNSNFQVEIAGLFLICIIVYLLMRCKEISQNLINHEMTSDRNDENLFKIIISLRHLDENIFVWSASCLQMCQHY